MGVGRRAPSYLWMSLPLLGPACSSGSSEVTRLRKLRCRPDMLSEIPALTPVADSRDPYCTEQLTWYLSASR